MPCFTQKFAFASATAGIFLTCDAAVAGSVTVVVSAAAVAALAVAFATWIASAMSLADCMENNDRRQDAESLRREIDAIKTELQKLRP
jgi:hypothetical protein